MKPIVIREQGCIRKLKTGRNLPINELIHICLDLGLGARYSMDFAHIITEGKEVANAISVSVGPVQYNYWKVDANISPEHLQLLQPFFEKIQSL